MANIPATRPFDAIGSTTLAPVVVGLTNTLTYNASAKQVLYVQNDSVASINVTLDGSDAPATVKVPGVGSTYNSAAGAVIAVPAGAIVAIPLGSYRALLVGDVTLAVSVVTSVTAWLIEV